MFLVLIFVDAFWFQSKPDKFGKMRSAPHAVAYTQFPCAFFAPSLSTARRSGVGYCKECVTQ
jgi:hypothetical protein